MTNKTDSNEYQSYVSKDGTKLYYTKTEKGTKELITLLKKEFSQEYKDETSFLFGFDIEKANKYPSTIQLSTKSMGCLFHIAKMTKVPQILKDLLEDEKIYKCGVGIIGLTDQEGDDKYLRNIGIQLKGIIDLTESFKNVGLTTDYQSLDDLSQTHLNLQKRKRIKGKWTNELSEKLIDYAIYDAVLGSKLSHFLFENSSYKKIIDWSKNNLVNLEELESKKEENSIFLELKKDKNDPDNKRNENLTKIRQVSGFYKKRETEKKERFDQKVKQEREEKNLIEEMKSKKRKTENSSNSGSNFSFNFLK